MNHKLFVFGCLLAVISASQHLPETFSGRIVGGKPAFKGEFPHQVSVQEDNSGELSHLCGGSIINETWILTAAHCFAGEHPLRKFYVKAGRLTLKKYEATEQLSLVAKIIAHRGYPNIPVISPYDIALLKLEKPLVFNELVQPIELPKQDEAVDGQVILSGWGSTNPNGRLPSNILQRVNLPIVSNKECEDNIESLTGRRIPIELSNLCTGPLTSGTSPCSGDSGGPLIKHENGKSKQVGIVSWGLAPCGERSGANVYTLVASYVNWIESNIADN